MSTETTKNETKLKPMMSVAVFILTAFLAGMFCVAGGRIMERLWPQEPRVIEHHLIFEGDTIETYQERQHTPL